MKQLFLLLAFTVFVQPSNGQTTFNLRDRYDFLACTLTGIVPTDSCYYATGIIADTIFPYNTGAIFIKYDLEGQVIFAKTLSSTTKTYETWYNSLTETNDGKLMTVGFTIDSTIKTILIKYDLFGDTAFTKEYANPFYPNVEFIKPWGGSQKLTDGGFVISNHIESVNGDPDYYLIRTDSLGNMLWGKVFGTPKFEISKSVKILSDGNILVGGIRTNQTTNVQDYVFQCHLFQFDTAGNYEWEWTSPLSAGLRDAANDMLVLDDGSIIVASGIGHEQQHPSVNEVYFDRYVFKLNPQHQIEWELAFPDSALTGWSRTTNLVNLTDGSGYILAGMEHLPKQFPIYKQPVKGWFAKISLDGDSIWTRRYAYLDNTVMANTIYDVKETLDGGLIICGQSHDYSDDAIYPQQGWLLKLDEHGCLVPGCHLSDAVEEEKQTEIQLAIYPNPTTDYLNFFLRTPNPAREATFRIVNSEGKLMKEFKSGNLNSTFIVPVRDWAAGVYWLQAVQDGRQVAIEKVVIVK